MITAICILAGVIVFEAHIIAVLAAALHEERKYSDDIDLITSDVREDKDMVYSKATLDRELQQYTGSMFVPYERRYG